MKREGRQRGMVRTYRILPSPLNPWPESRVVNRFDSPPTAGMFTKVSTKPTNHSKFTGKCGRPKCVGCHIHPPCKSKDKAKGTQKLRSSDVASDYTLATLRVADAKSGSKLPGFSAVGILDNLESDNYADNDDDDGVDEGFCRLADDDSAIEGGAVEIKNIVDGGGEYVVDDDDDNMGFCDVGLVWEQVDGEEGWCLVGENVAA